MIEYASLAIKYKKDSNKQLTKDNIYKVLDIKGENLIYTFTIKDDNDIIAEFDWDDFEMVGYFEEIL